MNIFSNISVIQLYFRTLNIERRTLYQETLLDFLCKCVLTSFSLIPEFSDGKLKLYNKFPFFPAKVGGWLGLAIGASIFSFIEIMAFIFVLVKQIIQTLIKLMRKNKE